MTRQFHNMDETRRDSEASHRPSHDGSDADSFGAGDQAGELHADHSPDAADPPVRAAAPFVWQFERRLLLLDEEPPLWVLAELEFDVEACRYVEVRRASYQWPREAVGALLSRSLASGRAAATSAAEAMDEWFSRHYGYEITPRAASSIDHDRPDRPL